jgi:tetratricopeptide (TPR) repeat protein
LIVLKALNKEPSRRYASAEQFAEDIGRLLRGMPVIARPDTLTYRTGRFVSRHKVGVIAAAAIVLALATATWSTARSARQARLRQVEAEAVTNFLTRTLSSVNPEDARGREVSVVEVLDRAAAEIDVEFQQQPLVKATLHHTIGQSYESLGKFAAAADHFRAVVNLREDHRHADDPQYAHAKLALGRALLQNGDFDGAEPQLRESLALMESLWGGNHVEVASAENELAMLLIRRGKFSDAEAHCRRAIAAFDYQATAGLARQTGAAQHLLALSLDGQQKSKEAEQAYRVALDTRRKAFGEDHLEVAKSLHDLGCFLDTRHRRAEAITNLEEALRIRRAAYPKGHPSIAESAHDLGLIHYARGDLHRAVELQRDAVAVYAALDRYDHPWVGRVKYNLAAALLELGQFEDALPVMRDSLALLERAYGARNAEVMDAREGLDELLHRTNRLDELRENSMAILEFRRKAAESPGAKPAALSRYAAALLLCRVDELRNPSEALRWAREGVEKSEKPTVVAQRILSLAHEMAGDRENAVEVLRRARASMRPTAISSFIHVEARLLKLLRDLNRNDEIAALHRESARILDEIIPRMEEKDLTDELAALDLAEALAYSGHLRTQVGDYLRAEHELRESWEICERILDPEHWQRFLVMSHLGDALLRQGRLNDAEPLVSQGFEGLSKSQRAFPTQKQEAAERCIRLFMAKGDFARAATYRVEYDALIEDVNEPW